MSFRVHFVNDMVTARIVCALYNSKATGSVVEPMTVGT